MKNYTKIVATLFFSASLFTGNNYAQNIAVNTTGAAANTSAMLDISSGAAANKGLLIPRVTAAQKTAMNPLPAAAQGLVVYQTDAPEGFYYNSSTTTVPVWNYVNPATGWTILGNAGTSAATNFIGTTDAIDWVIRTTNTERMRVLAGGNVGIGIAAPTQRLDVQGGNARVNNTFVGDVGHGANWGGISHSLMASTTGYAMIESNDGAYTLINKQNTGSGWIGFRVANADVAVITNAGSLGIGTTAPVEKLHITDAAPNTATLRASGLASTSTLTSNATDVMLMTDVNGSIRRANETVKDAWYTTGNATTGVRSFGTTTAQAFQFICNNVARGRVNPTDGEFVWGATASPYAGDALVAVGTATTPFAVNGYCNVAGGAGTWGEVLNASNTNFSALQGVYGGTGQGAGALGNYAGTNTATTRSGVVGYLSTPTASNGGVGVTGYVNIATATNSHIGVLGYYNGATFAIGVHGIGFGGGMMTGANDIAVVGWRANNSNYSGYYNGNHVIANGTKTASVGTSKGNQLLYCEEATEVWFDDIGTGQLINGTVTIDLDPLFLETVVIDEKHPMHVFIQMQGESNDVYVVPGTTNFVVKERSGGTSNAKFSYRIMAKRMNFQDHRFGNDPLWGPGDTRQYSQYAPPPPIDYEECVRFWAEQRKNWKQGPMPANFIPVERMQKEAEARSLIKPAK